KLSVWTSSVRACDEFFVVAPPTGAQNARAPLSVVVSQGGASRAGLIVSASPDSGLATGRVSCQPSRFTSDGDGPGAGFGVLVHAASAKANAATTPAIVRVVRVLNGASPIAERAAVAAAAAVVAAGPVAAGRIVASP